MFSIAREPMAAVIFLLAIGAIDNAEADDRRVEYEKDLGHGFRLVTMASQSHNSFEGIAHFTYLFFRDKEIGGANQPCISPSGSYAAYREPDTGKLVAFVVQTGSVKPLSAEYIGAISACRWNESTATIAIDFLDKRESRTFDLQDGR